jgi:hypothetical protein
MSIPISKGILDHSVTKYAKIGESSYGNPIYSDTQEDITYVRVATSKKALLTNLGELKNDKLVLIFDCTNSLPAGTTFNEGDKIVYKDVDYIVREVTDPSGDDENPHHYRVALVGS